jgi:hypothetical protein
MKLSRLRALFEQESSFVLQLLLVFMCSVAVVPAMRQMIQKTYNKVTHSTVALTPQIQLPPQQKSAKTFQAKTIQPKTPVQTAVRRVVTDIPLKTARLQVRSGATMLAIPSAQTVSRRPLYKAAVKIASQRKLPKRQADPVAGVRQILKQDYKVSKATGSYDSYMNWVRKTLQTYQKSG